MEKKIKGLVALGLVFLGGVASAATDWSSQDYDLYPGDFNGDGKTDLLYVAKDPSKPSGIAISDGTGQPNVSHQTWAANYLGIPWSNGTYTAHVRDFSGDGKADILLQRTSSGDSFLLHANTDGKIVAISQAIGSSHMSLTWTADQHKLVPGDYNADGKTDLFFQATGAAGTHAIVLADSAGQFTGSASQTWNDGFLGLNWSTTKAFVYSGKFNGDSRADLLVQARPHIVMIDYEIPIPIPTYPPNMNGVAFSQSSGSLFQLAGVQTWSRTANGVDWSPLSANIVVGDFNNDGRDDVILQGRNSSRPSYLLTSNASGSVFPSSGTTLSSNVGFTGDTTRLIAGNFDGSGGAGLYYQALVPSGTNYVSNTYSSGAFTASSHTSNPANPSGIVGGTAVGATSGAFSVSDSGAATYSIPIAIPPGIAGVQPNLSLNYNSNGGNGWLGLGWSIGGLPVIERCPRTEAQDGSADRVRLTSDDAFCFSGNRLRGTAGTYGANDATYQTEIETFARFTSKTQGGVAGPAWFKMEEKDGLIYEFGNSSDSRILSTNASYTTTARLWALRTVRDRSGNTMTFSYQNDGAPNGSFRPSEIVYTSNANTSVTTGAYKIQFHWDSRPSSEITTRYFAGGAITETQRLNRIETHYNGGGGFALVRKYQLGYGLTTNGRSAVAAVQECDASSACLPATQIGWQHAEPGAASEVTTALSIGSLSPYAQRMDLNGDGKQDVVYPNSSTGAWSYALATGSGFGSASNAGGSIYGTNYQKAVQIDYNADGLTDLLIPDSSSVWQVLQSTGTSFTTINTSITAPSGVGAYTLVGDIDGDGRQDIAYLVAPALKVRYNTGSGFGSETTLVSGFPSSGGNFGFNFGSPIQVADFNADGRADFATGVFRFSCEIYGECTYYNRVYSVVSNGSGSYSIVSGTEHNHGTGTAAEQMAQKYLTTDLNGDGHSDLLSPCGISSSRKWCVRFGTGAGVTDEIDTGHAFPSDLVRIVAVDWDADGRTDILQAKSSGNWDYFRSTGSVSTPLSAAVSAGISVAYSASAVMADINGDSQPDMTTMDGSNVLRYRLRLGASRDVATTFMDGFGNSAAVSYGLLTDSAVYTKGTGATFPQMEVQAASLVAKQANMTDGVGGTYNVNYLYKGVRVDLEGRGNLGFSERSVTDTRTGIKTTLVMEQAFPKAGMPSSIVVAQTQGSTATISSTTITNSSTSTGSGRTYPFVSSTTVVQKEVGGSENGNNIRQIVTATSIDSYGTPTSITETKTDLTGSSHVFVKQIANTVHSTPDTTNWCVGFITQSVVTSTPQGQSPQSRTVSFTKDTDAAKCRVGTQTVEPGSDQLVTTLGYDAFGNVNSEGVSGTGVSRLTTLSFGSGTGVFPVSITRRVQATPSVVNEVQTLTWNYKHGRVATVTDPNGLQTGHEYDGFGRMIRQDHPDTTDTYWAFSACNNGNAYCGDNALRYQVTEQQRTTADAVVRTNVGMYDAHGRSRYQQAQTLSGAYSVVATRYDALGRVSQQSQPYFVGFAAYFTTFTYDILGRPTQQQRQVSEADASSMSYQFAYERLTHTQTDPLGNTTKRYLNAIGQVKQVRDDLTNDNFYTYHPFGNLLTATDPMGNKITNTYNARGFKTGTADPDMGTWAYTYFPTGEIKTQQSPKMAAVTPTPQTVAFTYDGLGRPLTRSEPEGVARWVWGTSSTDKNIGQVVCINVKSTEDSNCSSTSVTYRDAFTYDSYGRVATQTSRIDGTNYVISSAYNSATGLLEQVTYPTSTSAVSGSRFKLKYEYAYGVVQRAKDDNGAGTVYWESVATNAFGQAVDEQFGNGLHTISSYDDVSGLLTGRTTGSTSQIQNLTYQWDKVGNLTQRSDGNVPLAEHFCYDDLYRLTGTKLGSTCTSSPDVTIAYDAAGNITSKTGVGSYAYPSPGASSVRPHAVSTAGTSSFTYDANGNMTQRTIGGVASTTTWFSYDLPNKIDKGTSYAQFSYGPSRARYKQVAVTASGGSLPAGTETTLYVGGLYERVTKPSGVVEYKHSIIANGQIVGIRTLRSNSVDDTRYLQKDHLGSVDAITNESGAAVLKLSYDAFGKRRSATTWTGSPASGDWTNIAALTHRGYTEHEGLDNVDLIHMNGRVYDPVIGRFTSPDPFVFEPFSTQGMNRYSYVYNNPLTFTDPTGFDNCRYSNSECSPDNRGLEALNGGAFQAMQGVANYRASVAHALTQFFLGQQIQASLAGIDPNLLFAVNTGNEVGANLARVVPGASSRPWNPEPTFYGRTRTQIAAEIDSAMVGTSGKWYVNEFEAVRAIAATSIARIGRAYNIEIGVQMYRLPGAGGDMNAETYVSNAVTQYNPREVHPGTGSIPFGNKFDYGGYVHTHPAGGGNTFSRDRGDFGYADGTRQNAYLLAPNHKIYGYMYFQRQAARSLVRNDFVMEIEP